MLVPMTWSKMWELLSEDRKRLRDRGLRCRFTYPPFLCVALYRFSRQLHLSGCNRLARLVWHVNVVLTGADICPASAIGGGLLVLNPVGVSLVGAAGRNLTVMAQAGLGGELGRNEDIGAGPGIPVLGDDVYLSPASGVLGPVRIGSRVRISAGCIVTRDVADDSSVAFRSSDTDPKFQFA
jgi:serine O-acetyltransferase